MNDPPARQICGEVASRRRAPRKTLHLDARRLGLRLILARGRRQLLKLQFQLIDEPLAALGARSEHLALHLGDHQLKVLDEGVGAGELGVRFGELGMRFDERRLERIHVVGELFRCRRHERNCTTNNVIRASKSAT